MIYKREDYPELYEKVIKGLGDYILNVVSKPNPVFNGMPPCPFAKGEWLKNRVDIVICDLCDDIYDEGQGLEDILNIIKTFSDNYLLDERKTTLILVDHQNLEGIKYTVDEGIDLAYALDEFYQEKFPYKGKLEILDMLTSNPEEETDWGPLNPYFSILVQNSELLKKSIQLLGKVGYYKNLPKNGIVEGIGDDPLYKGIQFKDGIGNGSDDFHNRNLYEELFNNSSTE